MKNRTDIIIFGATGYTGQYCVEAAHQLSKKNGRKLTWGIAGRSEKKLRDVLINYEKKIGEKISAEVPLIVADVNDYDSLVKMTSAAKIIVNCTGPYRFFGEPVIKACIETSTHQVDVTGEPDYMKSMQLKYHKAAEEKGIYIVSGCGFDSIPADMGVVYLQKHFQGTLNSVETYLRFGPENTEVSGPIVNFGTWESVVYAAANQGEMEKLDKQLYPNPLPKFNPELTARSFVHKSDITNTWCLPFVGADSSVVQRSQRYFYDQKRFRPVQIQTYQMIKSTFNLFLMVYFGILFVIMVNFKFGRYLLLQFPSVFTVGAFSREKPIRKEVEKNTFSVTFQGLGWREKLSNVDDQYNTSPNVVVNSRVETTCSMYAFTSAAVTLSAVKVLTEKEKLPSRGGVFPPGAAFVDTTLIEELQENGVTFKIDSIKNL